MLPPQQHDCESGLHQLSPSKAPNNNDPSPLPMTKYFTSRPALEQRAVSAHWAVKCGCAPLGISGTMNATKGRVTKQIHSTGAMTRFMTQHRRNNFGEIMLRLIPDIGPLTLLANGPQPRSDDIRDLVRFAHATLGCMGSMSVSSSPRDSSASSLITASPRGILEHQAGRSLQSTRGQHLSNKRRKLIIHQKMVA